MTSPRVLNINVGILGHVDSGKTSLAAALSTHLSTAALDKHPQSKERGITLDLGFSSFSLGGLPPHLAHLPYDELQFTLVDCPGHASLIRTIIGGLHIIDMMMLVIDVTKGLQAQTAECLVVAEVATPRMLVVLNKIDMLPEQERGKAIRKAAKRLAQTLQMTKFAMAPMVPVSAKAPGTAGSTSSLGIEELKVQLMALVPADPRQVQGPFLFAIDHCFPIKGQGTVLTGTVLKGSISVGEVLELPALKLQRPVRSMQAFRRPVSRAAQGDRVGVCVAQLDPDLLERGLAAAPGSVPTFNAAIAVVEKIRFYGGRVAGGGAKMHVCVGHDTVMAEISVFGLPDGEGVPGHLAMQAMVESMAMLAVDGSPAPFVSSREYLAQDELYGLEGRPPGASTTSSRGGCSISAVHAELNGEERHHGPQWALLKFDQPVTAPQDSMVIGARLDMEVHGDACRLAFYGRLVMLVDPSKPEELSRLMVYKIKERYGTLERMQPDGTTAVCKGLFKKETDISVFAGLKVTLATGEVGIIEGSFGKSGKFKVAFSKTITLDKDRRPEDNQITLRFKKYLYDPDKRRRPKQ